jgi:hypothetical protein
MWNDDEEGSLPGIPNRKGAEPRAVGLGIYAARKRSMIVWSAGIAAVVAGGVAFASPIAAVALAIGSACGIANSLISMAGNEQLLDHNRIAIFVLSTVLRFAVFGIVPVALAIHGPAWTLGPYLHGFLSPLGVYIALSGRPANGSA